ncbi:MAG: hypothetical protein ACLTFJ_01270 [Clostridium sp.]
MKKRWLSLLPVLCMMLWVAPVTALADASDIAIDETNFPDEKFREIVKTFDTDSNDILSKTERDNVTKIECNNKGIQSLEGIAYFEKLDSLKCTDNELTTLDVSGNPLLYELHCGNNQLTGLDLDANTKLWYLLCSNNKIDSLDVSKNVNLMKLFCALNNLTSLDLTSNSSLQYVQCQNNALTTLVIGTNTNLLEILCDQNKLTSLDVSSASKLKTLVCSNNALMDLDVSNNPKLKSLKCDNNKLTELDVSLNNQLGELYCSENQLTSLDISNCASTINFTCSSNFYPITFDTDLEFDLSGLPGDFKVEKSSNWLSGKVTGSILTPDYDAGHEIERIAYDYDCGHGKTAKFNLDVSYNHMYDGNWSSNATHHWKQCTNPKCPNRIGSYKDYGTHVYDDAADTICNDCGYNRGVTGHTHTYGAWTHDTSKHWKECTDSACPDKSGSVKDSATHVYDNDADTDCNVCGYTRTIAPPHSCAGSLVMVGAKAATCTADGNKEYYRCGTCGKLYEDKSGTVAITDPTTVVIPKAGHSASADYKNDADKHWKECTVCKVRIGETAHTYDSNGTCTTCRYKKPSSGGSTSGGSTSGGSSGGGSSSGGSSGGGSSSGGSSGGHHSSSGGGGSSSRRSGSGSSTTPKTLAGSWKQNQNGWWYQYTNGTWPSNSWVKLLVQGGETWYYFNKDGYMSTGWLFENNIWYYLDPQTGTNNGRMMTGWQQIGGQWYYFNQNGSMATGWNYINNNWYFLDHQAGGNNGRMMTGWHMISDKWYYFSTDKLAGEGSMYADRMTPDGFYVNKDGVWVQ